MVGIPSTIKQYAQEDINAALGRVSHNMKFKSMTFETSKVSELRKRTAHRMLWSET